MWWLIQVARSVFFFQCTYKLRIHVWKVENFLFLFRSRMTNEIGWSNIQCYMILCRVLSFYKKLSACTCSFLFGTGPNENSKKLQGLLYVLLEQASLLPIQANCSNCLINDNAASQYILDLWERLVRLGCSPKARFYCQHIHQCSISNHVNPRKYFSQMLKCSQSVLVVFI